MRIIKFSSNGQDELGRNLMMRGLGGYSRELGWGFVNKNGKTPYAVV